MGMMQVADDAKAILKRLGVPDAVFAKEGLAARSPIDGSIIGYLRADTPEEAKTKIARAAAASTHFRLPQDHHSHKTTLSNADEQRK